MDELIRLLKEKGDEQIIANLTLILKNDFGILRKFQLKKSNYKLSYLGNIDDRELIFKSDISKYVDKYGVAMCQNFYNYWSERTQDGKKMKWEREKTWEVGKRLATWNYNQQKRGY